MEFLLTWLKRNDYKLIFLAVTVLVAFIAAKIAAKTLRRLLDRSNIPNASIFVNLVLAAIWIIAAAMVLQPVFGINPTTIVTALGIGGLAISLGLKDTIANIVSGFGLMAGHVIQPGDYVSISGVTGIVKDITWRQTVVREANGNELIIPNSVLNTSQLERLDDLNTSCITVPFTIKPGTDLSKALEKLTQHATDATSGLALRKPSIRIRLISYAAATGTSAELLAFAKETTSPDTLRNTVVKSLAAEEFIA
ncbi:Mechanosensitive ion channel [Bifidobacterium bohemicum]|uniref:Small-conductance mechanosensitive channel protein n=1 Tax=Bifidobacterium bohemicum DSM 22767 TaxID=1437606 RepID=A0A086ZHL5_9BIFI|nr:mechanosensitive ion channel domain-containing protein [Bifidobacterium bohemicum]KFI46015.1 small-conductance mechanosensitive channel protein [Bifidobacterium bohemicum DSM 22767]SCC04771.1 Mechanosensitive ion channel [Bifidobacterium bohemicum]